MRNGTKRTVRTGLDDKIFSVFVRFVVLLITAACLIPFLYLAAVSLSETNAVVRREVFLIPKGLNLEVYKMIVRNGNMVYAMGRTIVLTVVYVVVAMTITVMCAYPLSVADLKGKKYILLFIMFTMYFSGGMIPTYLLINGLGLIDSYLALILPCALSTYNMIVMRSFFANIPISLREAAMIDGASDIKILTAIILPLSKPALATIALFYGVGRWNGMQDAFLYINDPNKSVLQIHLRNLIMTSKSMEELMLEGASAANMIPEQTVKAGVLVFSLIPVLLVYPFLQKYFVKGTMIGSVKG